jgi:hypothetical protein
MPSGGMPRPDIAAAASARPDDFDGAAISPPRISRFELKAGVAVLVLVLGGGLLWWSNQNDSRLAELALTAAAPASSTLRTVAETAVTTVAPPPSPERSPQDQAASLATPAQPVAPAPAFAPMPATAPAAAPVSEAPPAQKNRTSKHKSKRQHVPESEAVPVIERSTPAPVSVAESAPPPVEKRRPNLREQVASCRRLTLFEGERCLWRLCDGKWGKDGCPAYN